jgi:hypothetical protein
MDMSARGQLLLNERTLSAPFCPSEKRCSKTRLFHSITSTAMERMPQRGVFKRCIDYFATAADFGGVSTSFAHALTRSLSCHTDHSRR